VTTTATSTQAPTRSSSGAVVAALLGVQFAFASWSIVGKVTLAVVPPVALIAVRLLGGALFFSAFARARGFSPLPPREALGTMAGLALLGVVLNQLCFTMGLARTSAINTTVLGATIPVFTALYAFASGRERGGARVWAGLAIALAGVLTVARPERLALGPGAVLGNALILVNSACYAAYLVRGREQIEKYTAERVVTWVFVLGAAMVVPLGVPYVAAHAASWGLRVWLAIGYVVLVPTAYAYGANAWALSRAPASLVAAFIYLQPVLAIALALGVGDALAAWLAVPPPSEHLTARTAAGTVAILVGVWVSSRRR
jgi:drug/metabolite transporter (DMT)-like permease